MPVPSRLLALPVERGWPVPWFVALGDDGHYDFRVMDARKVYTAVRDKRCWICGESLYRSPLVFVVGPMCAINRVSSEPPSHPECAEYAARVCPFLVQREAHRRPDRLPADAGLPAGEMIMRQPGVALLWTTRTYRVVRDGDRGLLFRFGEPVRVDWLREGRPATRAEVEHSIETGLPILQQMAERGGPHAVTALATAIAEARRLLPAEGERAGV